MPEWTGDNDDPTLDAESWEEAVMTCAMAAKDKPLGEFLAEVNMPEPQELQEAAVKAVATLLAAALINSPGNFSKMPDPQLLVHILCVGAMAGAVYAVTNLNNAVVKVAQDEETQPEE